VVITEASRYPLLLTPEILQQIRNAPRIPFDQLDTTAAHLAPTFRRTVDDLFVKGWRMGRYVLRKLTPPVPFDDESRSFAFHLHALEPTTFLLQGYESFSDLKYLDASFEFSMDWIRRYQVQLLDLELEDAIAFAKAHVDTKAWYDMAVGQRVYRLSYLLDSIVRLEDRYSIESAKLLYRTILFHHLLLSQDDFFVGHTNHGLYQALGQLAAARRFLFLRNFDDFYQLAERRLESMIDRSFFPSGSHREHSPGYHHLILSSVLGARRSGLLNAKLDELLVKAEDRLAWMIAPNGALATIGDTDLKLRSYRPPRPLEYDNQSVKFLWSGGRGGEPPPSGFRVDPEAGYVFVRSFEGADRASRASYLMQTAAFHSRTHKHADHLSFVWNDRGHEILIDPGRFSYAGEMTKGGSVEHEAGHWYADHRRIYVEKTRAHNCVEIDGRDYPRKSVRPFGSALESATQQGDLFVTSCAAVHFRNIRHWRCLILRPHRFLLVIDWLFDRTEEKHRFRQWFQFGPTWNFRKEGEVLSADVSDGSQSLRVASLLAGPTVSDVVSGQTEPELRGWRSDKADSLVPSPTLFLEQEDTNLAAFATLVVFSKGLEPDLQASRVNRTLTRGVFAWTDDRGRHRLDLSRQDKDVSVTLAYLGLPDGPD
jgi:hypothetical protein